MAEEREQAIAAITAAARHTRRATPRWVWLAAAVVGIACTAGFALVLLRDGEVSSTREVAPPASSTGFGAGIAIGIVVGLGLGLAIARRHDHSSRNSP